MGKNAKLKENQKWSEEKIHLDNARKLRGIYFIDPEDKEYKETIKNARKKLETSVAPAMPCKIMKNCGRGGSDKNKTKLACILEANESTRMRMGNSEPHNHEDHIAGKGENSLQHSYLVHKFILMPQCRSTCIYSSSPRKRSTFSSNVRKAGALAPPPSCLGGGPHGWVPVNTHSTPVLTSVRRLWVA